MRNGRYDSTAGISMNHEAHKSCVCQLLRFVCSRIDGLRCATHFYGMQASIEVLMTYCGGVSDYHMETKETAITRKTDHTHSTPLRYLPSSILTSKSIMESDHLLQLSSITNSSFIHSPLGGHGECIVSDSRIPTRRCVW